MLELTDVKIRVSRNPATGHFWDGKTWRNGRSVALCGTYLYPRVPDFFMTKKEMKEVPFCPTCLSQVKR
jgi:hypothetical protein